MRISEYTEICLKFAKDTKNYNELDSYAFYTTDGAFEWKESCDNAHGGLSVKWAFHKAAEYIKENAAQEMMDELCSLIQCALDDEWDKSDLQCIIDMMS